MQKLLLLIITLFALLQMATAQGTIFGKITDDEGAGLNLATVAVYRSADTSLVAYRLSDNAGAFKVSGIPVNIHCYMVISFTGFEVLRRDLLLKNGETLDLGTIKLLPSAKDLDEVLVTAERPPVVIRKDTVEFNANAFKTLPNAVVEDLLKKLPGVQVDKNGNITVAGKPVNKIMVDGKSFFGSDPKMASRNLPAHTIDKIQVTDDMDELNARGDDNRSQVGKVINLTFKKGYKKGLFGKAYAGAGTESRYEAGMIANVFRDTLQVSLLGYGNNLNRTGFTGSDLMQTGGLSRSSSVSGSQSMSCLLYTSPSPRD